MIAVVRVPYLSEYNKQDVREEPVVTSLLHYLVSVGAAFNVYDFHLDKDLTADELVRAGSHLYIFCVRGTGLHWKYAERLSRHILLGTSAKVVFYGQTGKLHSWINPDPLRISILPQDERGLAVALGLPDTGPVFDRDLRHHSYAFALFDQLGSRRNLFKATFETTRGCHFKCNFCFINHGVNYPARFQRRLSQSVLEDIRAYRARGISTFWFYDAEFLGADKSLYGNVRELLSLISEEFDRSIDIMIYNRADTLERFNDYQLLVDAGVNCVLIGVESLDDVELAGMRKGQKSSDSLGAIRNLRDRQIFCVLSFILFNKDATLASIERNIERLTELYHEDDFIYLGQTHYFSYAFESDWSGLTPSVALSGLTRLAGSTSSTLAPNDGVIFDPSLEPLAEICRIINYEQIRKLCELNLSKEEDGFLWRKEVHHWAALLNLFTLNLMNLMSAEFRDERLSLTTVGFYEEFVYEAFNDFNNMILPQVLSATVTDKESGYPEGDWNGWERRIPSLATSRSARPEFVG